MSDDLVPELKDFIQVVDEIYGLYFDTTTAFVEWRKKIIDAQEEISHKLNMSIKELDNKPFGYGESNVDPSKFNVKHMRTQHEVKERLKKGGVNFKTMANLCVVLINEYWNFTRALIEKKYNLPRDSIKSDLMGDIRHFRNSILKHHGIGYERMNKCKILKWFKEGDPININKKQFEEIVNRIKKEIGLVDIKKTRKDTTNK